MWVKMSLLTNATIFEETRDSLEMYRVIHLIPTNSIACAVRRRPISDILSRLLYEIFHQGTSCQEDPMVWYIPDKIWSSILYIIAVWIGIFNGKLPEVTFNFFQLLLRKLYADGWFWSAVALTEVTAALNVVAALGCKKCCSNVKFSNTRWHTYSVNSKNKNCEYPDIQSHLDTCSGRFHILYL